MASARGEPGTWRWLGYWDEAGNLDLAATRANLPCDDEHLAELVRDECWPGQLHYVAGDKLWFLWNGRYLEPDLSLEIGRRVALLSHWYERLLETAHQAVEAEIRSTAPDPSKVDAMVKARYDTEWKAHHGYATKLRGPAFKALIERLEHACGTAPEALTSDPWHTRTLNCWDRVINLLPQPGEPEWYPHDPRWKMTYCVEANYQPGSAAPDANCPEYRELLWMATGGNEDVYWWLIKVLGYSLLGSNPLQLLFFLSGPTASGKTTLLHILSTVLGPQLAYGAKPDLVAEQGGGRQRHARHEATMRGKRLITISETNQRLVLDELQVKRLTGEDSVSVEMLWQAVMTKALVTWLIILANNEMPSLLNLDPAIRRRVWVGPMGPTIDIAYRDTEKSRRILAQERDGILSLMVWGCRAAMAEGGKALLEPPADVIAMTMDYAAAQDTVALWLAECCVPNGSAPLVHGAECYRNYRAWCEPSRRLGRNQFYNRLGELVMRSGDKEHAWFGGFELRGTEPDRWPGTS